MFNCTLYMRADYTVSSASDVYYDFVRENSRLPFTDLIDSEDADILRSVLEETPVLAAPLELVTGFYNRIDETPRNVHIFVENCDRTEDGARLYFITIIDVLDARARMEDLKRSAYKYRYYMSIKDEYYFEYYPETNIFQYYKYVNGKNIMIYSDDLARFEKDRNEASGNADYMLRQTSRLASYLRDENKSFEMSWVTRESGEVSNQFLIKGGTSIFTPGMVTGVIIPGGTSNDMAYYLTSAGKDPFTGLLNKKASTEYSMEKLRDAGDAPLWMLIMDIDDFKTFNDNFGHAFGDEVIKTVAGTLQVNMGMKGVVGRFGGDEFYALLHNVPTRDDLKLILKVVARELLFAYDDKKKLTMSIGVSQYPKDGRDFDTLFGKADKCLYIAKEKGKNRHIIYDEEKHGAYTEDSIKFQAVSYIASHEKRRALLSECFIGIHSKGVKYFLENKKIRRGIMEIFDLNGITIYGDGGRSVILRDGKYAAAPEDRYALADEAYREQYKDSSVMVINNLDRLKSISEEVYASAVSAEIGSSVRCAVKRGNSLSVFVDFDVFNTNRKWSDADVDVLTILGCTIGEMIISQT